MLSVLRQRLGAAARAAEGGPPGDAAVLIAVSDEAEPRLILTRRAAHLNSHAGEVAFPGGKKDPDDASLARTALREAHEEIGLDPGRVEIIGQGRARRSRWGLQVQPVVGIVPVDVALEPNAAEIAAVFRVPLSHFLEPANMAIERVEREGRMWEAPAFEWDGTSIWGLTAIMIVDLMNDAFDYGREIWR